MDMLRNRKGRVGTVARPVVGTLIRPFLAPGRALAAAAIAALCLAPLAWAQAPAAKPSPVRGGTVVLPIHVGEPASYDCHATNSPAVMWRVAPHYSTLLKIDPDRFPEVAGDLARTWTVSTDKLSYRFTLHPYIKFHDGSPLTSADV